MRAAGDILALASLSCLIGGMAFFGAIMAPLVFGTLEPAVAGRLIRATFPRYYLYVLSTAALAALGFALRDPWSGVTMAAIAVSTIWLRQGLMPAINRMRDAQIAGDSGAKARFDRAHRLSVSVNQLQLLAAIAVLVRVALR